MKRFLLACCMFVMVHVSFSQTIQLTNGGSTTLSGTTGAAPISAYFEYMRFQVVYTAAELNAAGITGPKSITELGWYISTAPASALPSYTIRMANTTATNSAAHDAAALTTVYSSPSYSPVAGGFNMLTLNGSFIWNGTDNVLVDVCFGAASYTAPYGEVRTYAATTTSGSRRVRCDACGSQCGATTNTTNTFKPQVSLTFVPPPSCVAPAGLSVTAITNNSATLNWGAVGGATGYEWAVTTSATPPASGTATALTTAPSGVLTSNTLYYLHVRTNCGGPFSSWATTSFTTLCATTTVPYSENLDGSGTMPSCFVLQDLNGNTTWTLFTAGGNGAASGTNSIRYNWNTPIGADDWFYIQGLNLTGGTSYTLKFKYKSSDGPTFIEKLEVKYGSSPNAASMTAGTLFSNTNINTAIADPFIQASVDFTPGSTGDYYIGFHCFSDADQAFLYIDDIEVALTPSCAPPTALVNSNVTHNAADHSWTAPGVPPSNGYYWTVTTSATPPANGTGTATAGTTASSAGLLPVTQYYLHVQSFCGLGVYSAWVTLPFTTSIDCSLAEPITDCADPKTASLSGTGSYSITACGFSTPGTEKLYTFVPGVTGNYTLNITAANGEYIDYFYKPASAGCGTSGWLCIGDHNAVSTDVFGPLTAGTTYYILLDPEDDAVTSTVTFQLDCPVSAPPNDLVCNAIPLTLSGPQDCQNTTGATVSADPTLFCSTPNNTVWYTYTPAANGIVLVVAQTPASGNPLNGWVQFYTATGTCPTLTLTQVNAAACTGEFGQNLSDSDTLTSPVLTGGTTYYIMIDGFSGDVGEYCIKLIPPPAPPACTTNLLPANGATGVVISPAPAISWNAAATASSYDVYFGTVNPPVTNIGNTAATTVNITGLSYNTTYYWYVVPKNSGGAATGCDVNTTSFTTENPTNCTPLYTTGCSLADSLTYFSLKGASGTVIYNQSGATCSTTPVAYSDYTGAFSPVTLVRGESFGGFMRTGDPNDYASIWIDSDDDGYFETNERVMNNLKIGTTMKLYTLYVPATTALGTHRMRVRVVYYGSAPTTTTDPCNSYTYGETEDYLVNITNVGSTHNVATGTPGTCITAGAIKIDAASNNNGSSPVFLVDSLNNYVGAIYPNGNNFGTVTASYYVHNGAVRQTGPPSSRYYLDRNLSIAVDTQATVAYNLRYFFLNSELNALIAQPGSGVTSIFDLTMTKTAQSVCTPVYDGVAPQNVIPTGFGSMSGDRFLDFTGLTSFSTLYLHGGVPALLPIDLLSFAGQREGSINKLRWTTATEQNNRGFDVQRSLDGMNFESIGFVNSLAPGGNSSNELSYSFVDNNVGGRKFYYRLRQLDIDGRSRLSSIVLIKGDKPVTLAIDGLYPNPANTQVNVVVAAPVRDKVTLIVVDMTGKTVLQQIVSVEAGSNTFPVDISKLTGGTYMVKMVCNNCETAISKFVKQ